MSYEQRAPKDYTAGVLSQPAAVSDTSLTSSSFASLGTQYSTTNYMPIVLNDPTRNAYEVAWITGHTSGSSTVTVVRGREGSTAQAWPTNSQWICAPTAARDALALYTASGLAAIGDPHTGMRALETDTNLLKKRTFNAGWVADAGVCLPSEVSLTAANTAVPATATILCRMGNVIHYATGGSAVIPVTFATPFPNGYIGALSNSTFGGDFIGCICCESGTQTGMSLRATQFNGGVPGLFSAFYMAFGW